MLTDGPTNLPTTRLLELLWAAKNVLHPPIPHPKQERAEDVLNADCIAVAVSHGECYGPWLEVSWLAGVSF